MSDEREKGGQQAAKGRIRRPVAVGLAAAIAVVLTATAALAVERVRASGTSFRPKKVEVSVGERVVWRSTDGTHTVTSYRGDWSKNTTIDEGERTSFTFSDAGRYRFRCTIHSSLSDGKCSGMCGTVVVG